MFKDRVIPRIALAATLATVPMAGCDIGTKKLPYNCINPVASAEQNPSTELTTPGAKLKAAAKRLLNIRDSYGSGPEYVRDDVYGKSSKDPGQLAISMDSLTLVFSIPAGDPLMKQLYVPLTETTKEDVDRTEFDYAILRNDKYPDTTLVFVDGEWHIGKTPSPEDYTGSTFEKYAKDNRKVATDEERTDFINSLEETISSLDKQLQKTDPTSC